MASVPAELADDLAAAIPECEEEQPECSGPCPILDSLSAECAEEGFCDVRLPAADDSPPPAE
ncbi:MAG: hypothetical protein HYY06_05845 [Deltaproteobacteria bacterium]|nr:hypothetical protein [Deltaproteobacteria bacterium]